MPDLYTAFPYIGKLDLHYIPTGDVNDSVFHSFQGPGSANACLNWLYDVLQAILYTCLE